MTNSHNEDKVPKSPTKVRASSTKAQNGSSKSGRKHSHMHSSHSHSHHHFQSTHSDRGAIAEWFMHDERDHRSFAVKEFDAYQEAAKRKHEEELKFVVKKTYG